MGEAELHECCKLDSAGCCLLRAEESQPDMSARAYHRTAQCRAGAHHC